MYHIGCAEATKRIIRVTYGKPKIEENLVTLQKPEPRMNANIKASIQVH